MTRPAQEIVIQKTQDGLPVFYCTICNKPVDYVQLENPVKIIHLHDSASLGRITPTGERIVTVCCHGETWQFSNWSRMIPGKGSES